MAQIRRALITGGCGFIGANLVRYLRQHTPWALRAVDDLRAGRADYVPNRLADVTIGDVADASVLEPILEGIDALVHLATQTGVQPSIEDPQSDFEGNIAATFRVLDACRRRGIRRVVFASSSAAVGEVPPPIHEDVVPKPVSPYGAGKLSGEAYCRAYAASFGMETVALRFSNAYGPFSLHKKNVVPTFVKRCLAGEPIVIYGDGSQTRDFIHVDDLCDAIRRALTTEAIGGEVFQVATGTETSVKDLAALVRDIAGGNGQVRFEPTRTGDVYRSRADITKAQHVLGFDPGIELKVGISQTVGWYRDHWSNGGRTAYSR